MVGDRESEPFWSEFLHSLRARVPGGGRPVIADHRGGPVKALRKVRPGDFV
ncbi:hypothetical protein [Streptomyces sp. IMTB 2501]|uniref:hypothetical protein n=1 Tax=Streptomyces sp. IMTB 2501 TaxID=1776340 RepID=UPI000D1BED25|nr:hypothetical protein [Streptomyces sp. IMTB 2501]